MTADLRSFEIAWREAKEEHRRAYAVYTRALLAEYRTELAWLRAGGRCVFQDATERITEVAALVDEWSRVIEHGEDPRVVWPEARP
jgi:hypothetical protein